jgi:hypothetical protein
MIKFPKKANGTGMGCTDTARPVENSSMQLSRVYDAMHLLEDTLGEAAMMDAWKALPYAVKMEMNYSNWTYVKG